MRSVLPLIAFFAFLASAHAQRPGCEFEKLLAIDAEPNDRFGRSVALLGDLLAIGAPEMIGGGATGFGSAYVHRWDGFRWRFDGKLVASDGVLQDVFGLHVATDGERVLVGAPLNDADGEASGSAYVFRKDGDQWVEEQRLDASDPATRKTFGNALFMDGELAFVGAPSSVLPASHRGAVYAFERTRNGWSQKQRIEAIDGRPGDFFGASISRSGDRLLIGAANGLEPCASSAFCGAAYVFKLVGDQWQQEQKLVASMPMPSDWFGFAVALQDDWAFVGGYGRDVVVGDGGLVDVYRRIGGQWQFQSSLAPSALSAGDGFSVGLSVYGDTLIGTSLKSDIACPSPPSDCNAGAAFVFRFDGANWVEHGRLVASDPTGNHGFGISVSLDADRAVVGAWNDDEAGSDAGAGYVFQLNHAVPGNGDADFDDDVDWADYARFMECFDLAYTTTCCVVFDFDDDGDIDLADYDAYLAAVTGP